MIGWLVAVATTMCLTVVVGVLVHELLHAAVLRSAGVDCSLRFRPENEAAEGFRTLATGALASVGIESVPANCSLWRLRVAALAPLAMVLPVAAFAWLLGAGSLTGSPLHTLVVICWLGCALPSPADFAIVWHTEDLRTRAANAS